jgi:hypothetical protein
MVSNNLNTDQFVKKTDDALTQLDGVRTEQMQLAKDLLATKDKFQQKERERLIRKYGIEHPEVKKIEARLAFNQQLFPAVDANIDQSAINTEPFSLTTWRVYGFVYDSKGNPLEKITVLLTNPDQQPLPALPYACTNPKGYYAITLTREQIADKKTGLLLAVTTSTNQPPIIVSKEPILPNLGKMEFRDIILNQDQCPPPFTGDTTQPPIG